jgi:hypothetical protein
VGATHVQDDFAQILAVASWVLVGALGDLGHVVDSVTHHSASGRSSFRAAASTASAAAAATATAATAGTAAATAAAAETAAAARVLQWGRCADGDWWRWGWEWRRWRGCTAATAAAAAAAA